MVEENRKIISDENELQKIFEGKKERYEYKDKSLMSKMGFHDDDLKTSTHDDMFVKIIDPLVINKISKLINLEIEFSFIDDKNKPIYMRKSKKEKRMWSDIKPDKLECMKWYIKPEFPVVTDTGFLIGFVDVLSIHSYYYFYDIKDSIWEGIRRIALVIEIKSKIDSIGELLRQINTYKQYMYNTLHPVLSRCYRDGYLIIDRKFENEYFDIYYVVISNNTTETQKRALSVNGTYLLDMKELEELNE